MNRILMVGLMAGLVVACGGGGGGQLSSAKAVVATGTITGFGSIVLDGVRYETGTAQIEIDDQGGRAQSDLSVGQRVTINGRIDDAGNRIAERVEYEAELNGVVTTVDVAAGRFEALGQSVQVESSTVFLGLGDLSALAAGDFVEVSGSRRADGSILASFVKREAAESEVELRGQVSSHDAANRRFMIEAQTVDYATALLSPAGLVPDGGTLVEVEGVLQAGVLVATKVFREDEFGGEDAGTEAHLGGLIVARDEDGSFTLGATRVRVLATTRFEAGSSAADLIVGAAVEVEGTLQADGSLLAREIEFEAEADGAEVGITAPITVLDGVARTLQVLGQEVRVVDTTRFLDRRDERASFGFSNLVVGDVVDLSLVVDAGGLSARKLERIEAQNRVEIEGAVDTADAAQRRVVVAGVTVDTRTAQYRVDGGIATAEQFYAAVAAGGTVEAEGTFGNGQLTALEVSIATAPGG